MYRLRPLASTHRDLTNVRERLKHVAEQAKEVLLDDVLGHNTEQIDIGARTVNAKPVATERSATGVSARADRASQLSTAQVHAPIRAKCEDLAAGLARGLLRQALRERCLVDKLLDKRQD